MPSFSALARTQESAASADSFITSPSWPVSRSRTSLPPGIAVASMNRMSPPALVRARPTTTPGMVVRSAVSGRCGGGPSASDTNAASIVTGPSGRVSATRRAALRIRLAMKRSRLRTPASRVYSCTTLRIASSSRVICSGVSPCASRCFGTR
jgi:hypothetical protein